MSHKQLRVLEAALDLYSRLGIGQLEIVAEKLGILFPDLDLTEWEMREWYTDPMKRDLFEFGAGASFGVCGDKTPDDAKISHDLQKTIQKQIAVVEEHDGMSVWHDGNLLHLGSEPVAEIEEVDE